MLNHELHEVIGDRIRELTKIKEKSLTKMIETCELNRNFMYDLSKAKTLKSSKTLVDIANFFDCSADFLLGRTDNPQVNFAPISDISLKNVKKSNINLASNNASNSNNSNSNFTYNYYDCDNGCSEQSTSHDSHKKSLFREALGLIQRLNDSDLKKLAETISYLISDDKMI